MANPVKQIVKFEDLSKAKLAVIVNEQADLIEALARQVRSLSQSLIAIVLEPDAFHPKTTGIANVDASALQRVKAGQHLSIEVANGVATLRVVQPSAAPVIERPRIVIPHGVRP